MHYEDLVIEAAGATLERTRSMAAQVSDIAQKHPGVQNVLGIERQVRSLQQRAPQQANQLSVLMELQADCFAGIWGHSTAQRNIMEPGDAEEGLRAAGAIGDDALQQQASGRVRPESFTHGSAAQRVEWLRRGLQTGKVEACDTFSAAGS